MQQYYRIALGMCLLIGYLQAQPLTRPRRSLTDDLRWDPPHGVTCKPNVTFTAVEEPCYAALQKLIEGWEHARENCDDSRIGQILEALNNVLDTQNQTQTKCDFTTTVYEQFGGFVNATQRFAEAWNAKNMEKPQE